MEIFNYYLSDCLLNTILLFDCFLLYNSFRYSVYFLFYNYFLFSDYFLVFIVSIKLSSSFLIFLLDMFKFIYPLSLYFSPFTGILFYWFLRDVFYNNFINLLDCYYYILLALKLVYFLNNYWNLSIAFDYILFFIYLWFTWFYYNALSNDPILAFDTGVWVWFIVNYYLLKLNPFRVVELLANLSIDLGGKNCPLLWVLEKFNFYILIYLLLSACLFTKNALGLGNFYCDF